MKKIIKVIAVSLSLLASTAHAQIITYDPGTVGTLGLVADITFHELDGALVPTTLELDFVFSGNKQYTVRDPGLGFSGSLVFHLDSFGGGTLPAVAFLTDMDGNNILDAYSYISRAYGTVQEYSFDFDLFSGLEFHGLHLSVDMSDLSSNRVFADADVSFRGDSILEITEFTSPPVDAEQVPEPGTLLLMSLGLLGLIGRFRRNRTAVV